MFGVVEARGSDHLADAAGEDELVALGAACFALAKVTKFHSSGVNVTFRVAIWKDW